MYKFHTQITICREMTNYLTKKIEKRKKGVKQNFARPSYNASKTYILKKKALKSYISYIWAIRDFYFFKDVLLFWNFTEFIKLFFLHVILVFGYAIFLWPWSFSCIKLAAFIWNLIKTIFWIMWITWSFIFVKII